MAEFEFKRVGLTVHDYRISQGWSLKSLAKRACMTPGVILRLEGLVHQPRESTIRDIAEGLGVSCSSLFGQTNVTRNTGVEVTRVGEIVQQIRWERDLSLRQMSRLIGLSHAYICNIENGGLTKELAIVKIAKGLNIGVNVLLGEPIIETKS